jgi:hypothetical protein
MYMSEKYKFKGKTCGSCAFYHITDGRVTWNVCVAWPPQPTATNQYAMYPYLTDDFIACSCYEPLEEERPVEENQTPPLGETG